MASKTVMNKVYCGQCENGELYVPLTVTCTIDASFVDRTKNTKTEPKRYLCETAMSCSGWIRTTISKLLSLNALCFIIFETLLASWLEQRLLLWEHFKKGLCRYTVVVVVVVIITIIIIITNNYYYFYYYGACFTAGMSMPEISVPSHISGRKKLRLRLFRGSLLMPARLFLEVHQVYSNIYVSQVDLQSLQCSNTNRDNFCTLHLPQLFNFNS